MEEQRPLIRQLILATNQLDGSYYFCARRLGINENRLSLLYALDDGVPHTQKQLSEDWLMPKTTVNTVIREMQSEGYVMLSAAPHSREKMVCLTAAGRAYAQRILRPVYQAEQRAYARTLTEFPPEFAIAFARFAENLCLELQLSAPAHD